MPLQLRGFRAVQWHAAFIMDGLHWIWGAVVGAIDANFSGTTKRGESEVYQDIVTITRVYFGTCLLICSTAWSKGLPLGPLP